MDIRKKVVAARLLIKELEEILLNEGEANWVRGVIAIRETLEGTDYKRCYAEGRSIYQTMTIGQGTFSDYYIERQTGIERVEANRRLDELRDELWRLLGG